MISVLVPVYNVEKYLRRCIDSVLAQSFKDWEMILVDDGSPDRCPQIIDEYTAKDRRINAVHKTNGGLPSARLAGFQKAHGDYIIFLDSDDWLLPNALQILYNHISEGWDLVKCRPMRHNGVNYWIENYRINQGVIKSRNEYAEAIIYNDIHPYLHSGIYRKNLFSESVFNPIIKAGISFGEDWFANVLIIDKVHSIKIVDQCVYAYFVNEKSMVSSSTLSKKVADAADSFLYKYLDRIDPSLSQKAFYKNYIGALNDLFKPEIPFKRSTYNMVRDFFYEHPEMKKRVNKKYKYFINRPILFYIYSRIYVFLFKWVKLKGKRRKMV